MHVSLGMGTKCFHLFLFAHLQSFSDASFQTSALEAYCSTETLTDLQKNFSSANPGRRVVGKLSSWVM